MLTYLIEVVHVPRSLSESLSLFSSVYINRVHVSRPVDHITIIQHVINIRPRGIKYYYFLIVGGRWACRNLDAFQQSH